MKKISSQIFIECCNRVYDAEGQHFIHIKLLQIKPALTQHQTSSIWHTHILTLSTKRGLRHRLQIS